MYNSRKSSAFALLRLEPVIPFVELRTRVKQVISHLRIILTIDLSPWSRYSGGAQQSTHNLAQALSARGNSVSVVYTKPPWERIDIPTDLNYQVYWSPFLALKSKRVAILRPLNAIFVAKRVGELVRRCDSSVVVHCNGEEGGMLHTVAGNNKFGVVSTPRHSTYPTEMMTDGELSIATKIKLVATEGKYLMQRKAARQANAVTATSDFAADLISRACSVDRASIHVVPNGLPPEFLSYKWREDSTGPIVFFGRFDRTKGADVLVEALRILDHEAPPTMLVGRGTEEAALRKQIEESGLGNIISIQPWMDNCQLGRVLEGSRMAVLPSRHESFGLAVASALAVGTPVISTRTGGIPELIEHNKSGILVEPGDPVQLAKAIRTVDANRGLARQMSDAGRTRTRSRYTWESTAMQMEEVYRRVLNLSAHGAAVA